MSRIRVKAGGKSVFSSQRMLALCTLLVLFAFFSVFGKRFFSADTMMNLIESSYYIICMALGMTFIIATGGIDLSIGTVGMCGAIVGGVAYNVWGLPMWCALLFIVATTTLFGALNGFLVAYCKLPAFVATMGVMMISQGVGYIVSEVQTMRFPIISEPDGWFKRVFFKSLDGFPMGIIYVVILFLIAAFLLRYTKLGKYACAIGSNKEATRLSGVNTKKWEMLVYVVSGVFYRLCRTVLRSHLHLRSSGLRRRYGNASRCGSRDRRNLSGRRLWNDCRYADRCVHYECAKERVDDGRTSTAMAGIFYRHCGPACSSSGHL